MQLITKNKTISLVFTTKKIIKFINSLNEKNFENFYFKMLHEKDTESLAKMIYAFAEDDIGAKSFKDVDEVLDFIDDYKKENDKTYNDILEEIAEAINEEGFFNSKMNKKEMKEKISGLTVDMDSLVKNSAEKVIMQMTEQEFQKQNQ